MGDDLDSKKGMLVDASHVGMSRRPLVIDSSYKSGFYAVTPRVGHLYTGSSLASKSSIRITPKCSPLDLKSIAHEVEFLNRRTKTHLGWVMYQSVSLRGEHSSRTSFRTNVGVVLRTYCAANRRPIFSTTTSMRSSHSQCFKLCAASRDSPTLSEGLPCFFVSVVWLCRCRDGRSIDTPASSFLRNLRRPHRYSIRTNDGRCRHEEGCSTTQKTDLHACHFTVLYAAPAVWVVEALRSEPSIFIQDNALNHRPTCHNHRSHDNDI